jgi:hypothetical protein
MLIPVRLVLQYCIIKGKVAYAGGQNTNLPGWSVSLPPTVLLSGCTMALLPVVICNHCFASQPWHENQ